MERIDELREHIKVTAVASIPRQFLEDFAKRAGSAYIDTFLEVKHDAALLKEQRIAKLRQTRPFRMDWEMAEAARKTGLACTPHPLPENDWHHAYTVSGDFGLTQSYVPTLGALPQPAKFRENLANAARIPRFDLDDSVEIYLPRKFYGLLAHNPIGKAFDEDQQKLGSLQLCVPYSKMKGWALEISVAELISLYPVATKDAVATGGPTWKTAAAKKEGNAL